MNTSGPDSSAAIRLLASDAKATSSYPVRAWHWNGARLVHGGWQRKPKLSKHLPGFRL
jgi:hypothetical protein